MAQRFHPWRGRGPEPLKAQAPLRVAEPLLSAPVADRPNWTLVRLAEEIASREGATISRSQLSKVVSPLVV